MTKDELPLARASRGSVCLRSKNAEPSLKITNSGTISALRSQLNCSRSNSQRYAVSGGERSTEPHYLSCRVDSLETVAFTVSCTS